MLRLLLFCTILEFVRCSCPDGFELVGSGQCRETKPYASMTLTFAQGVQTAIAKCNEIDAQPVIIHNDEEYAYWKEYTTGDIILGLICNTTSKRWEWSDGSASDYTPQDGVSDVTHITADPLNADCTTRTGCTWEMCTKDASGCQGIWWMDCEQTTRTLDYSIYCTKQLQQPVLPSDGCLGFDDDNDDSICYLIGATAETWQDAQMACKELGANLASIHNANENSFIRRLAVSKGAVHGVFLGATVTGKGDSYGWIDGSAWDYENFYPGFHGVGDCIAMDTSTSSGLWVDVDCTQSLPVACVRERKSITIDPRNVTCDAQTFAENTLITSPGFPFDASVSCDYFLTVDTGKRVEMEIVLLEANSCCDHLLIDEGYFGGYEIANLTGAIQNVTYMTTSSNKMKVSWQPNGGVNVRGMAITFRGV